MFVFPALITPTVIMVSLISLLPHIIGIAILIVLILQLKRQKEIEEKLKAIQEKLEAGE